VIEGIYKSTELVDLMYEIRDDLSKQFPFDNTNSTVQSFRKENLAKNGLDSYMGDLLIAVEHSEGMAQMALEDLALPETKGTCFNVRRKIENMDYVIAIFWPPKSDFGLEMTFSEEIMHGEHHAKHAKHVPYGELFSRIAQEFFGGLGKAHLLSKHKNQKFRYSLTPARYDAEKDHVLIDPYHLVGYQLSEQAYNVLPCSELFEITDENELWKRFNDVFIPNIQVPVPVQWGEDGENLIFTIKENLLTLGLDTTVELFRYDQSQLNQKIIKPN
jgi:hypothetical protein